MHTHEQTNKHTDTPTHSHAHSFSDTEAGVRAREPGNTTDDRASNKKHKPDAAAPGKGSGPKAATKVEQFAKKGESTPCLQAPKRRLGMALKEHGSAPLRAWSDREP